MALYYLPDCAFLLEIPYDSNETIKLLKTDTAGAD